MLRQTLKTEAIHQLVDACFRKYPNGLVTNVRKYSVNPSFLSEYYGIFRSNLV